MPGRGKKEFRDLCVATEPKLSPCFIKMESLGKRFEEARKRKGVSLREAAEATKLRTDYLAGFENDDFEIGVPEIYVRGFIKLYARYLGMDLAEIQKEISVLLKRQGSTPQTPAEVKGGSSRFEDEVAPTGPSFGRIPGRPNRSPEPARKAVERPPAMDRKETDFADEPEIVMDKALYVKIGAGALGVLVLGMLLIILIRIIFSGGSPDRVAGGDEAPDRAAVVEAPGDDTLLIRAVGRTEVVIQRAGASVREAPIWRKIMEPGEVFEREIPDDVDVIARAIENLEIERRGERIRFNETGARRLAIDRRD